MLESTSCGVAGRALARLKTTKHKCISVTLSRKTLLGYVSSATCAQARRNQLGLCQHCTRLLTCIDHTIQHVRETNRKGRDTEGSSEEGSTWPCDQTVGRCSKFAVLARVAPLLATRTSCALKGARVSPHATSHGRQHYALGPANNCRRYPKRVASSWRAMANGQASARVTFCQGAALGAHARQ